VGYGRIDPPAALDWKARTDVPAASQQLEDWVRMHRRAEPEAGGETASAAPGDAEADGAVLADGTVETTGAASPVLGPVLVVAGGAAGAGLLVAAGVLAVRGRRTTRA
jgi:hypothetical protein